MSAAAPEAAMATSYPAAIAERAIAVPTLPAPSMPILSTVAAFLLASTLVRLSPASEDRPPHANRR
jgi:hypothetical protein